MNFICQKIWKFSSCQRTGKGQFSFQSQRKAMPKNVQTTVQLHAFHTLISLCSKFLKLGFNSMWTEKFQMFKLNLEKAEEPEIRLLTSTGSQKKQENSRQKHLLLLHWPCQRLWLCGSQQTVENSSRDKNTRPPYLPPEKSVCRTRSNS